MSDDEGAAAAPVARPAERRAHAHDAACEPLLLQMQRDSLAYFTHETNPANGLVADKTAPQWPASIAAVGMALTAYVVAVERGAMTHAKALSTTLVTLRFLLQAEQSESPIASGYKGFFYHFLDMQSGSRVWKCELSSIDTALLMAGVLTARAYFSADSADECELRATADALYERVDWRWMQSETQGVCLGWTPESGFLRWHWRGYDESLILHLLGLGSPTHPLTADAWRAWTDGLGWTTTEGISCLHAAPLFIHQMSHLWIDLRGIRDDFMRAHDCDYFENSRRAALVQQRYAMRNPKRFEMYGEFCWGITASDGPGATKRGRSVAGRTYYDYVARGAPDGPDDGTLAPWAVVASLPFAPEIVLPTIAHLRSLQLHTDNAYGFKASFNATFPADRRHPVGWVSRFHFGINEGPTVVMIENQLSGLVWRLMRGCAPLVAGLRRAGFDGGWLAQAPDAKTPA
jgi:hypothetical protein